MIVIAHDEEGHAFPKTVKVRRGTSGIVIDFGGYIAYYLDDLLAGIQRRFGYVLTERFYVDGMGRNHRGSPVFIGPTDFMAAIRFAYDEVALWT